MRVIFIIVVIAIFFHVGVAASENGKNIGHRWEVGEGKDIEIYDLDRLKKVKGNFIMIDQNVFNEYVKTDQIVDAYLVYYKYSGQEKSHSQMLLDGENFLLFEDMGCQFGCELLIVNEDGSEYEIPITLR